MRRTDGSGDAKVVVFGTHEGRTSPETRPQAHAAILRWMSELLDVAAAMTPEIVRLRRNFHRFPELSYVEHATSRTIREYLEGLGLTVHQGDSTGMWADLDTPGTTKRVAFRADMDALAMDEVETPNKSGFTSENEGAAHCCGHDAHMAMLLAAARLLATDQAPRSHNVRFVFQHAEERAPGGAIDLIEQGCLEGVDEIYGMHVIPPLPAGRFSLRAGAFMAAADELKILVRGKGGHAAYPHLLQDPVVAASQIVMALQTLVSRRTSPLESLVVSIATIRGGTGTTNVIPDEVELKGTVRTLDAELHARAPDWIREVVTHTASAAGCRAEIGYVRGYPVLVNDADATERGKRAVRELFGETGFVPRSEPWMGGEDFARYAERRPACFAFLGVGNEAKGIVAPNHATNFDVDEEALWRGTAWFLKLADLA
ncbi:MAG: amidohydrolase [Planctomycetes bacterium]|nr:amidohydrolase [Planctomycetota bacterium]